MKLTNQHLLHWILVLTLVCPITSRAEEPAFVEEESTAQAVTQEIESEGETVTEYQPTAPGDNEEEPVPEEQLPALKRPVIPGELLFQENHPSLYEMLTISDLPSDDDLEKAKQSLPPRAEISTMEEEFQMPELPTGCESVALTIALRSLGFSLEKTTIAQDYLIYSDDNFAEGYVGDPFSPEGAGIFSPGIVMSANEYLADQDTAIRAYDASSLSLDALLPYVACGSPVLLWVTIDYALPTFSQDVCLFQGESYWWYWNEHCVAIKSYDRQAGTITLEDPLEGTLTMDYALLQDIHEAIHYAVVLR